MTRFNKHNKQKKNGHKKANGHSSHNLFSKHNHKQNGNGKLHQNDLSAYFQPKSKPIKIEQGSDTCGFETMSEEEANQFM